MWYSINYCPDTFGDKHRPDASRDKHRLDTPRDKNHPDITTIRICPETETDRQRERERVREVWEEGVVLYWEGVEQGWDKERKRERERERVVLYEQCTRTHACTHPRTLD